MTAALPQAAFSIGDSGAGAGFAMPPTTGNAPRLELIRWRWRPPFPVHFRRQSGIRAVLRFRVRWHRDGHHHWQRYTRRAA